MKAAIIKRHGAPGEVIECAELPDPGPPDAGKVTVRMLLASINPADILTVQGNYSRDVDFPFVPGTEGVGRVEAVGEGVESLKEGDLVVPLARNTWCERLVTRENLLIKVPADGPLEQLSMLKVNPATADRLLSEFGPLAEGDWVMQNVANSGVGQNVIQLAALRGLKTVNIVRRAELVKPLQVMGADVVLVDDLGDPARLAGAVKAATDGASIKLGLDAIAGPATNAMAEALGHGAELVNYGTLSREACQIDGRNLFQHDRALKGFWLTSWYRVTPLEEVRAVLEGLGAKVAAGNLHSVVEAVYPMEQAGEAAARADAYGRMGKILIALDPECAW